MVYVKLLVLIAFLLEQYNTEYTITGLCICQYILCAVLRLCHFELMSFWAYVVLSLCRFELMSFWAYVVLSLCRFVPSAVLSLYCWVPSVMFCIWGFELLPFRTLLFWASALPWYTVLYGHLLYYTTPAAADCATVPADDFVSNTRPWQWLQGLPLTVPIMFAEYCVYLTLLLVFPLPTRSPCIILTTSHFPWIEPWITNFR
jgi:hypothetical protein